MSVQRWGEKPYHSLDYELKKRFGEKIYKVSLDGGFTCPNRDGTLGTGGCIFCSGAGSGDFASPCCESVTRQIENGIAGISARKVRDPVLLHIFSLLQTPMPRWKSASYVSGSHRHPQIVMLSVGTRPDCLPEDVLDLLTECNKIKPVMIELGLQSIHPSTVSYIRRGTICLCMIKQ